jgi:hypothetical protein
MPVDATLAKRFKRQLAQGEVVLFTGAGFSYDAVGVDGARVPQVTDLKSELSRLAFPANPQVGEDSTLADLFDVAVNKAQGSVRELFQARLRVSAKVSPPRFRGGSRCRGVGTTR